MHLEVTNTFRENILNLSKNSDQYQNVIKSTSFLGELNVLWCSDSTILKI